MNYEQISAHFGTQERIASVLRVRQPSVSLWRKRGIPLLRQMQIQLVTGGLLVADSAAPPVQTLKKEVA